MKHLLAIFIAAAITNAAMADVLTETISVPMRDGLALATDLYRDGLI